jgi:cytochrome b6-f complex iron-sulfur subunit
MSDSAISESILRNMRRTATKTRRTFLAAASAAGICYAAALAYPVYRYLASPSEMALSASAVTEVTLKDAQKLPAGSVLMFKFGPSPAMLIHHEDGRWVALTAVCTHLGCTVQYEPQADRIHCACHGGVYNRLHRRECERAAAEAAQALQGRGER